MRKEKELKKERKGKKNQVLNLNDLWFEETDEQKEKQKREH